MKDAGSLHLKVQEQIDCHAGTDPLKGMSELPGEGDQDEAALKWLALTTLHGINNNASKILLTRSENGEVTVTAEYRTATLPSPGSDIGDRVIRAVRDITHISEDKGKTPLSLGIRNADVELRVKVKRKGGQEKISFKFPEQA
jgi:hypothetical protein